MAGFYFVGPERLASSPRTLVKQEEEVTVSWDRPLWRRCVTVARRVPAALDCGGLPRSLVCP